MVSYKCVLVRSKRKSGRKARKHGRKAKKVGRKVTRKAKKLFRSTKNRASYSVGAVASMVPCIKKARTRKQLKKCF